VKGVEPPASRASGSAGDEKKQVPEYILVTEEIGSWGGDIKKAELPDFCEIDYVRVYEMSK